MPKKVYMRGEGHRGGGTTFLMTWDQIEESLRSAGRVYPNEDVDFVITENGISVHILEGKKSANGRRS